MDIKKIDYMNFRNLIKKINKPIFIGLACSIIIAFLTASCGNQREKKVVKFAFWADRINRVSVTTLIDQYNSLNPEVTVEYFPVESPYERKLLTLISGGMAPDMMILGPVDLIEYAHRGVILPLDSYMEQDTTFINLKNDIIPGLLDDTKYLGKHYAVPFWTNAIAMIYNQDLFDKEHLSYPTSDWTWTDFLTAAKKLTKDTNGDGRIDQFGWEAVPSSLGGPNWDLYMYIIQNNLRLFSEDGERCLIENKEVKETIRWALDLKMKEHVAPLSKEINSGNFYAPGFANFAFLSGKVAMSKCGRWWHVYNLDKLKFKWGIAPLPKGKRATTNRVTISLAISQKTKYPEACWEFLKFAISKSGQKYILTTRSDISILYSNGTSEEFLTMHFSPEVNKIFFDAVVHSEAYPTFIGQYEWNDYTLSQFELVEAGKLDFDTACTNIAKKYIEIRNKNKI
ncbi:MAG: sugar ABC transporter substrate-binding protein [bacterium]|nr:sugar ABC transporter substrate-binding protein [bacterium]